jgi:FtsP/CotA-like multicopper oxidase with cupredoxin domain
MKQIYVLLFAAVICAHGLVAQNPVAIPPVLTGTTFDLNLQAGSVQFYPGQPTATFGANGNILGPTLMVNQGDDIVINVANNLPQETTIHWHGMHVSPQNDGGPHVVIPQGTTWSPQIPVLDWAGTYWYHPHLHHFTNDHVQRGIAGFVIVKDAHEATLNLPRTYGVDDFPLAVQTKAFDANNQIIIESALDTALMVNGTLDAFLDAPAQVVRLRLLNGSSERYYNFGFSNNMTFHQIASDGGLLPEIVAHTRLMMAPGERAEILVNLSALQGQTVNLMSYNSGLANGIYGAAQPGMGAGQTIPNYTLNPLNGNDFVVLEINVGAPTVNPVTTIPAGTLSTHSIWTEAQADITRQLTFTSTVQGPTAINGPFVINGAPFDMMTINYEIPFENIEIWELQNNSPIGHPFHIHDVQFYVLSINGAVPPAHLRGRKDVIHVPAGQGVVRFITQFETFYDDQFPYMYHCHMLTHEDDGMMGQFLVKSPCVYQVEVQPQDQSVVEGETAQFTVGVADPAATYQWQTDIGLGWQNLTNAGQYSGVNTSMLSVSNVTLSNNNQLFRCQIATESCPLTSEQAVLNVGTASINESSFGDYLIFPVPFQDQFVIKSTENEFVGFDVVDLSGRVVYTGEIQGEFTIVDASSWSAGTYFLRAGELQLTRKLVKD